MSVQNVRVTRSSSADSPQPVGPVRVGVTAFRSHVAEYLDTVRMGGVVQVRRHWRDLAVLVPPETYERMAAALDRQERRRRRRGKGRAADLRKLPRE